MKKLFLLTVLLATFLCFSEGFAADYFYRSGTVSVTSGTLTGYTVIDAIGFPLNLYWVIDGRTGRNNQSIALTDEFTGYTVGSDSETSATVNTAKVLRFAQSDAYAEWPAAYAYSYTVDGDEVAGTATFTPTTTPVSYLGGPTRITVTFASTQGANRTIKFNLIGKR